MASNNRIITAGLCAGRHEIPGVDNYIFPETIEDPMDFDGMSIRVYEWIAEQGFGYTNHSWNPTFGADYTDIPVSIGDTLVVYVTGCTPALGAVISICVDSGIPLTLMHYDRATGGYKPQVVNLPEFNLWKEVC